MSRSRHVLADYWGCHLGQNPISDIRYWLAEIAQVAGTFLHHSSVHALDPNSIVGVGVVDGGHITIKAILHTHYVSVTFDGGTGKPEDALDLLFREFHAESSNVIAVDHGEISGLKVVGFRHGEQADMIPIPYPPGEQK